MGQPSRIEQASISYAEQDADTPREREDFTAYMQRSYKGAAIVFDDQGTPYLFWASTRSGHDVESEWKAWMARAEIARASNGKF